MTRMQQVIFTISMLILSSLGFYATDVYLPSLPAIAQYFNVAETYSQLSVTAYLLAFSLTPLIFGPLSDRYGRKKIGLICILLGTLSTFVCIFALNIQMLILGRLLQGMFFGGSMIAVRAIVPDKFKGREMAKQLSYIMMTMPLILSLAPWLGGQIQEIADWHAVFVSILVYGTVAFFVLMKQQETNNTFSDLSPKQVISNYKGFITNKGFFLNSLGIIFPTMGFFSYLTSSPILFQLELNISPAEYGFFAVYIGMVIMGGSFLNTRLIHYYSLEKIILTSYCLMLLGGIIIVVLSYFNILTVWTILGPTLLYFTSVPFGIANSAARSMSYVHQHFGAATALTSCLQFVAGGIGSFVSSLVHETTAMPLGITYIVLGTLCILALHAANKVEHNTVMHS